MNGTEIKKPGVWKSFVDMLVRSKLPYSLLVLALIFSWANAIIALELPDKIAELVKGVTRENTLAAFYLGIANIGTAVAALIFKYIAKYKIDRNMQCLAVDKIFYLPMSEIERRDPREMVTRVTTDTRMLSELLMSIAVDEAPRLYFMIGALIKIFRNYNTTLGLVMLISIPVTIAGSWIVGRLTFGKAAAAQTAISELTARLAEKINNMSVIKSYNTQEKEGASGDAVIKNLEYHLKRKAVIDRLGAASTTLATLIPTVGVIAIGASMVLSGSVEVASFVAYYALAGSFIGYVAAHMTLWISIKNSQGATKRIAEILELPDERDPVQRQGGAGDIVFDNVRVTFGDNTALDGVSFTLKEGEKTAFVGFSGSGKSTALNLIEQFYRPDSGVITMGGRPIKDWDISSYRRQFTYVPQNAPGFSGTIRDILNYGLEQPLGDDALHEILKRVDAENFVNRLGGLDYEVGNNAEKLSGGQKQKLCTARALAEPKDIMLLDEATSALDIHATKKVQGELDKIMQGKTMILVAHNLATILNADKIIVFDSGRIVDQGTHQQLLKNCELYRSLVHSMEEGSEDA